MEHEAGSGWTRSPAQISDEDNRGNGVATPDAVAAGSESEVGDGVAAPGAVAAGSDCEVGDGVAEPGAVAAGSESEVGDGVAAPGAVAAGSEDDTQDEAGTGNERVDAALRLLDRLPGLPVSDHPELFEQVHAQLSEVLGELESGSMPGPAGR